MPVAGNIREARLPAPRKEMKRLNTAEIALPDRKPIDAMPGPRYGFPKTARILKRSEFLRLTRSGKRFGDRHFTLLYAPSLSQRLRLGVTVSKKVGNAVVRNRVKRQCKEFFRQNKHRISGRWDINLIARREAAGCSPQAMRESLAHLLGRLADPLNGRKT